MIRAAALLLTVVTGATGLVYEVAWQKYLATLLGSHAEATAAVLGLFLAGLSAGYALFGALSRRLVAGAARAGRPPAILRAYGAIEAGIGAWALAFPFLFDGARRISLALPAGSPAFAFASDVAIAALLLLPPTILMGGTIPLLTQGLSRNLEEATRFHAWVYAFNSAGAFLGSLAAGFVLLPWLGMPRVMLAMGAVNLAVGATFAALGRRGAAVAVATPPGVEGRPARPAGFGVWIAVALLCGFAMMVIQTALNRLAALAFGSSPYTFSMVVALFVLCIAIGSSLVSALPRIPPRLLLWDLGLLFAWFAAIQGVPNQAPFWSHATRLFFSNAGLAFYPYSLTVLLLMLGVVGPGVVLSGATLPLLFHHLKQRQGDLGALAGSLYGWNTVGSLLGALLGGHLLLLWFDLHAVYLVALVALATAFSIAVLRDGGRRIAAAVALAACGAAAFLMRAWDPLMLSAGSFRIRSRLPLAAYTPQSMREFLATDREVLFYDDDPIASVAVQEVVQNGNRERVLLNNGKPDGSTISDYGTQALLGVLPALLIDRCERAFVVGFGTGVTAGELAALDGTREVVVAEISSGVLAAAPFFASANLDPLSSPKLRVIRSDAYRALLREPGRFDLIVSEPSNPWMAGIEMLYSREFLEAAKSRLAPGGAYVQWLHTYESDDETVALVFRTFASVFPDATVWYALGNDLLLIGFPEPRAAFRVSDLARRMQRPDLAAALARGGITSIEALAAHELVPLGVLPQVDLAGPLHTLFHPRLSYRSARAFFVGGAGLPPPTAFGAASSVGARLSLVRQLAALEGGTLSDASRAKLVAEACAQRVEPCTAFVADWMREQSDSPQLTEWRLRAHRTQLGEAIVAEDVEALGALLAGHFSPATATLAPEAAARATALVRRYRQHAMPFDDGLLRSIWKRCRAPGGSDACARGLAQAEALLAGRAAPPSG